MWYQCKNLSSLKLFIAKEQISVGSCAQFSFCLFQTPAASPKWSAAWWRSSPTTSASPWMPSSSCSFTTWCRPTWKRRRKVLALALSFICQTKKRILFVPLSHTSASLSEVRKKTHQRLQRGIIQHAIILSPLPIQHEEPDEHICLCTCGALGMLRPSF